MDGFVTNYSASISFNSKYVFQIPGEPWGNPEKPRARRAPRRKESPAPVATPPAAVVAGSPFMARPDLQIRRGVCGMVAIAYAAKISRLDATRAYNQANGTRQKGASHHFGRMNALDALGVKYAERKEFRGTLESFARDHAEPGRLYMVRTPRHVVMVKDGWALDQSGPRPVAKHRHARKPADSILEILEH